MAPADEVPYRENEFFRGIPAADLDRIHLEPQIVHYDAGETIFEEGVDEDCCHLVEKGTVRISKAGEAGQETLGFIGPGGFFGEIALFYSTRRSARASAATPVRTAILSADDFTILRRVAPLEVTTTIANAALRHLRDVNTHYVQQMDNTDRFREIGVGLGVIAHDMRSPLATILSAAELLLETLEREPQDVVQLRKFVEMIRRTAERGLEGADELLALIRGEQQRSRQHVDIDELVQEVAAHVRGMLPQRNAVLDAAVDLPGSVLCERNELSRALLNLVRNAIEALPAAGGRIELRARVTEECAVFTVTDNGCGIPAELQGRIFERRFTHGKSGGTGLGLDQVRKVIERHGGRIRLQSSVGVGTTFTVEIPARELPLS